MKFITKISKIEVLKTTGFTERVECVAIKDALKNQKLLMEKYLYNMEKLIRNLEIFGGPEMIWYDMISPCYDNLDNIIYCMKEPYLSILDKKL